MICCAILYYTIVYCTTLYLHNTIFYTRSPLEDSCLFGPSPWKILATTYEANGFLSNPAPGENILSGNLVMETGCIIVSTIIITNIVVLQ